MVAIRGTFTAFLILLFSPKIVITQQACSQTAATCNNGHWSSTKCKCDCIPPLFCLDEYSGECVVVTSSSSNRCRAENTARNLVDSEEDGFSRVTIKFTISGLPDVVDVGLLEEEMLMMMKKELIDLSKQEPDLKVTNVEESPSFVRESITTAKNGSDDSARSVSIYYDITMINDQMVDFGPIIIDGLRDMYPSITQDINECTGMVYFRYGVGVNWCIDEVEGGGEFEVCVATHPKVTVEFRLSKMPLQLKNVDELIQQVVEIYEEVLMPVEELDILTVEMTNVVDLPSSNNTVTKEVYVEIADQKFVIDADETMDNPVFRSIIEKQIQSSKYEILNLLQIYSNNSTNIDLNWCVDGNGTFTVCANPPPPPESPKPYPFLLPRWAIITLTVVSVLLTCCICWCTFSFLEQRDSSKNERNLVSYLNTGQQYSKPKKKPIRSPPPPPQLITSLTRSNSRPTLHPRVHQQYYENRPKIESAVSLANDTKYLEGMPSFVFQYDDEAPPVHAADTMYLENMNSFVFDDDVPAPHLPITANETKYLEDAPSFIFDDGEDQSQNIRLAITDGEVIVKNSRSKPDP
jgi:hypothetical protein